MNLNRRDMLKVSAAAAPLAGIPMAQVEAASSDPRPCYGPAEPYEIPPDSFSVERRAELYVKGSASASEIAAKIRANLPTLDLVPADLPGGPDALGSIIVASQRGEVSLDAGTGRQYVQWNVSGGYMIEIRLVTRRTS